MIQKKTAARAALAIIAALTLGVIACIPLLQVQTKPRQLDQKKSCSDCHGDYHNIVPIRRESTSSDSR